MVDLLTEHTHEQAHVHTDDYQHIRMHMGVYMCGRTRAGIHMTTCMHEQQHTNAHTCKHCRPNVLGATNSKWAYRKAHFPLLSLFWMGGTCQHLSPREIDLVPQPGRFDWFGLSHVCGLMYSEWAGQCCGHARPFSVRGEDG